ncbi:MAG: ATP-binding protein [Candidatus Zixiibacteriota bacterium]
MKLPKLALSEIDASWLKRIGFTYEIRIRLTLAFMFLLIVVANLNSLRYFSQTQSAQERQALDQAAQNMQLVAVALRDNPAERINSQPVRDLALAAGFSQVAIIETDLLRDDSAATSTLVSPDRLQQIRRAYSLPKTIAGGIRGGLPASLTEPYNAGAGSKERSGFFHFRSGDDKPLTLVVNIDTGEQSDIARFASLNTIFQILSVLAALTMAVMLLKITMKPYKQIKSEALAADIARTDKRESVDFAVETFQQVIAELKAKEQKLQQLYAQQRDRAASLERYTEDVLRGMPSGVLSCNIQGTITHFNESAARILGVSVESGLGQPFISTLADWPSLRNLLSETIASRSELSIPEIEIIAKNNNTIWLSVTCSLVTDANHDVRGATILISDISELKRLEAEIVVKEQMAALGEMSAGLAHQLRNSMGAVIGFSQLLKKISGDEGPTADMVSGILREARSTGEMLDRFLKLSRVSEVSPVAVDFADIQTALQTHFKHKLRERNLLLEFSFVQPLPPFVCDQLLIANTLINLIENAIQASENGKTISVRLAFEAESDSFVLEVSDQGKGMTQDQLSRIFTPFYTSGKADGTGLGLALARKWVMAHGGTISCQSALDRGTTFRISLPLIPDQTQTQQDLGQIRVASD